MCSLITLLNILMNKKVRHIGKRKAGGSARKRLRKITHLRIRKFMLHKKKKKRLLYFKEDTIDSEKLQSAVPSLTSRERTVQAPPSKREEKRKKKRKMRKGKKRTKKKGKTEKAVLKSFFKHTAPSGYVP